MITPIMTRPNHGFEAIRTHARVKSSFTSRSTQCFRRAFCCFDKSSACCSAAFCWTSFMASTPSASDALVYWSTSVLTNMFAQKKQESIVTMT